MKTFSTFSKMLMMLVAVFAFSFNMNAANHSFATISDLLKSTDVKSGDVVTITGDVIFEYVAKSNAVIKDNNGDAACLVYSYYLYEFQNSRAEFIAKKPALADKYSPLKSGDILKNFNGIVSYSSNAKILTLEPDFDMDNLVFKNGIEIVPTKNPYTVKTTKVKVADLNNNPGKYEGKIVSLEGCTSLLKGFNCYLVQANDTLKKFTIYGLNSEDYPKEFNIDRALFLDGRLALDKTDYSVPSFKNFESIKATFKGSKDANKVNINIQMQVLRTENIDGKLYIIATTGKGAALYQHSAVRIYFEQPNDVVKNLKGGEIINVVSDNATFFANQPDAKGGFKASIMNVGACTVKVVESNSTIEYGEISPEEIHSMYYRYEFLPVVLNGKVTLTGDATPEQKAKNISTANFISGLDETEKPTPILVDITYLPKSTNEEWVLCGILDFPLWLGNSTKCVVTPLSSNGFISSFSEFDNIKEMKQYGAPFMSDATYKINSNITLIGNCVVKAINKRDEDKRVTFVHDGTSALELNMNSYRSLEYEVGDAFTGMYGAYRKAVPSKIANDGSVIFGLADRLLLDSVNFTPVSSNYKIHSKEVTLAELKKNIDKYASELVILRNVTYKKVVVESFAEQEVDTIIHHYIYQGTDSMAVSPAFKYEPSMSTVRGIFYLNDTYTQILPRTQDDINCVEEPVVALDVVSYDEKVYYVDGVVYAEGAQIRVYDVTGRLVSEGYNSVSVDSASKNVYVVRTTYDDNNSYVTKVVNK